MAKSRAPAELEDDGDSPMLDQDATKDSSPDSPATPPGNILPPSSELSPPDSQGPIPLQTNTSESSIPFNPLSGSGSKIPPSAALNANGKRSWKDNVLGTKGASKEGDSKESGVGSGGGNGTGASALKNEQDTGYQWKKEEDAPGFAWQNPKAREEYHRAWNTIIDKDRMIKGRYGDVLLG